MEKYSPWLANSECEKGALCLYCVMFPQPVRRGNQGGFIIRPFSKYRQFHDEANAHLLTQWHRNAAEDANNFIRLCNKPEENISSQINSNYRITIERNREKLSSLLKGILFCGMHDIALRGKEVDSGNLFDLYKFRAEAGDEVLQKHLESARKNARYTSVQTQNKLIELSADLLREKIVLQANESIAGFSLITETTDFSGIEQLSIGIRYVKSCEGNIVIHEEFLEFSSLNAMNAEAISKAILNKTEEYGLDMQKLISQGYDGCSTMAGEVSGVQKRIRELHPKTYFMHYASHRLNLVINDQNKIIEIRNAVGVIKIIIVYFRESSLRRRLVTHIPLLCETRWSEKYKSILLFYEHFHEIFIKLEELAVERNQSSESRQRAYQLIHSIANSSFLICLTTTAKYSAMFEPIAKSFQAINTDFLGARNQIISLMSVISMHRENAEVVVP